MNLNIVAAVDEATKKTMEYINDTICDSIEETMASINESYKKEIIKEISKRNEAIIKNQELIIEKMKLLEEKLDYLNTPFFKKFGKKNTGENK